MTQNRTSHMLSAKLSKQETGVESHPVVDLQAHSRDLWVVSAQTTNTTLGGLGINNPDPTPWPNPCLTPGLGR